MGDPISTFGVAAGAIQLTDLALRASREAYGFLSAVKDSERDVRNLKDTLRDVDSNVRSLREYVSRFSKSKASRNEFEVLPEAITGCLIRFHDDMIILKQMLPNKDSPSFIDKVKWVYDKRKIDNVGKRLHERRADIALAMSMVGR
ncbi:hypothetical protein BS50DRAFT_484268 [Corynespora cassiicola Philippines]|uniref:Azaphilone pigments biosynthesis cluster protein L N-terminal domain-containing protein n=1 Tax=Corynespora cassiicola Philippines TaxID=1448308 RepID=A0A2T2P234_CORCC|nr:hypothetical protein BS50DRAFT_484268 [Corynespora cassiicola Philippines]